MALFMNEQIDGETYHSFIPTAFGNALRDASAQVAQALGEGYTYNDSWGGHIAWQKYIPTMVTVNIETMLHPIYDEDAPPNTYKLTITPQGQAETIKTILQGFMPAAGAAPGAAPGAPAGAARRRKSRKSRKSKKTSRRRRSTRRT
jgi:hypothetical protein